MQSSAKLCISVSVWGCGLLWQPWLRWVCGNFLFADCRSQVLYLFLEQLTLPWAQLQAGSFQLLQEHLQMHQVLFTGISHIGPEGHATQGPPQKPLTCGRSIAEAITSTCYRLCPAVLCTRDNFQCQRVENKTQAGITSLGSFSDQ